MNLIRLDKEIGKGQFGTVFAGTWHLAGGDRRPVAIKRLSVQASEEEKSKFLREGARMMQFFHPNVVKLLGVATVHTPVSFTDLFYYFLIHVLIELIQRFLQILKSCLKSDHRPYAMVYFIKTR